MQFKLVSFFSSKVFQETHLFHIIYHLYLNVFLFSNKIKFYCDEN